MSTSPAVDDDASLPERPESGAPQFTVEVIEGADRTVARVRGEIDMVTCVRLRDAIEPHLGPGQRVVLELSGVSFMDSSCLNLLLHARTTLSTDGGSLILRNPSGAARRLLSAAGVAELFDVEILR
jgi:anti-anti-sigma factor